MRLQADAVVLVLHDPGRTGEIPVGIAVRDRGGEHECHRRVVARRDRRQRVAARGDRDRTDVAGEPGGAPHQRRIALERRRDRIGDESRFEADAQIAGNDLDDVGRLQRIRARAENVFEQVPAAPRGGRTARRGHLGETRCQRRGRQRCAEEAEVHRRPE